MYLQKNDMADEIFVINVSGYIGSNTNQKGNWLCCFDRKACALFGAQSDILAFLRLVCDLSEEAEPA